MKVIQEQENIDTIFCVSHFKGHLITGFGGALKNLGMGCASKGGKLDIHSSSKPYIVNERCTLCMRCFDYCASQAIEKDKKSLVIDLKLCTGCGGCMSICPENAIKFHWDSESSDIQQGIARYAANATKDKKVFCINFLINISPNCDCFHSNEPMIALDIGVLASSDPVSLDQACYDMIKQPIDKLHPEIDPTEQLKYAEKFKVGERKYENQTI